MNRSSGSRTVLTGSPGTIALTDPSDWVHMRIKTVSLPLSEFFLLPFSPSFCSPLCRSLSLSLTLPPLSRSPFYVSPVLTVPFLLPPFLLPSCFFLFFPQLLLFCSVLIVGRCWVSTADQIMVPKHLLDFTAVSPSVIRESAVALVCPCPVELNWKLWSAVLHSAVFKSLTLALEM